MQSLNCYHLKMPNLRKACRPGITAIAFPQVNLPVALAATITPVQLRETENARPMDCPCRGSDRGLIPRLLDAVGVCSLTYPYMSIPSNKIPRRRGCTAFT